MARIAKIKEDETLHLSFPFRMEGLRYIYFLKMFEMAERCGNCKGEVGAQKIDNLAKKMYLSLNLQFIIEMFSEQRSESFHEFS